MSPSPTTMLETQQDHMIYVLGNGGQIPKQDLIAK